MASGTSASFRIATSGLTLTLTDTSTARAPTTITGPITVNWGDGATDRIQPRATVTHTYPATGVYHLAAVVVDSAADAANFAEPISVTAPAGGGGGGGGGAGGGGGSGAPPPPPPAPPPANPGTTGPYVVTSQSRTIQVLASGQVIDVEKVGFRTTPSGVYSYVLVPLTTWQTGGSDSYLSPVATAIEQLIAQGYATGASYVQDVDPATGLLVDSMDFTVSYVPAGAVAPMTTTVRVSVEALASEGAAGVAPLLQAAITQLHATAGL